jgi:hypothetical protein
MGAGSGWGTGGGSGGRGSGTGTSATDFIVSLLAGDQERSYPGGESAHHSQATGRTPARGEFAARWLEDATELTGGAGALIGLLGDRAFALVRPHRSGLTSPR